MGGVRTHHDPNLLLNLNYGQFHQRRLNLLDLKVDHRNNLQGLLDFRSGQVVANQNLLHIEVLRVVVSLDLFLGEA